MTHDSECRVHIVEYRLRLGRGLSRAETTRLRGYFGTVFRDEVLLHHHDPSGRLLYTYPRVQFKVLAKTAHVVGIAEGAPVVERLWREVDYARIGDHLLPIREATLLPRCDPFGQAPQMLDYRFLTPWLGLNQDNYQRYCRAADPALKRQILQRVLVGNCLSLAKSLGVRVTAQLIAEVGLLRPRICRFKGLPMLGFLGRFRINFYLPARLGLGKSVSRGFGTVVPL